ncbi:unnamed protein product [Linum trigynum]|uniref:TIR domain-containing protein n=1 Tax=Linum trigynum TaxID=586398 RepID=A0AAV2DAP5_9ROSI
MVAGSSLGASSTSPKSRQPYHVFLSFRGSDTRKNFTDHLYQALTWAGIRTYRDDDEIERGDDIVLAINKAITESRLSLIVFSPNFASSSYCLDEVVKIMECKENNVHTVVPIFYNVSPSQVSEESGTYVKALRRHGNVERVDKWWKTLKKITDLGGMVLGDRHEAGFIQEIVKKVDRRLKRIKRPVPSYVIGIESHIEAINKWVAYESSDVDVAIISGVGGVGKTIIANIVFNMNIETFDVWSFLQDVDETSKHQDGLVNLQRSLVYDISKGALVDYKGIDLEHVTCNKRALVVLDNVDTWGQLFAILSKPQYLHKGSKIIITTRCKELLKKPYGGACKTFWINGLGKDHALELFSWHAFDKPNPDEGYVGYSEQVVQHCSGLPLALEVLGLCLSDKDMQLWEVAAQEPETIDGSTRIRRTLQISYDSLDERDKILFLDIACFYIGREKDSVVKMLQSKFGYRPLGIQELISRSLISIGESNRLTMHQLIRDMGREIVLLRSIQSIEDPGEQSRLWRYNDAIRVLKRDTGEIVRSLILDPPLAYEVEVEAFAKMRKLKLLHLNNVNLHGNYKGFPQSLVWLCWEGFLLQSIPGEVSLEDLVVLEMRNSKIRNVHDSAWILPNLKVLDLSHSCNLIATPDLSRFPKLERLILRCCTNLVEIHSSIGGLERLSFLDVSYCTSLSKLPLGNGDLMSLKELQMSGCPGLAERYSLDSDKMELPVRKRMRRTSSLVSGLPHFLVSISLCRCNMHAFPEDLSSLSSLKFLHLNENPLTCLPETIKSLKMLLALSLFRCDKLESLPELPSSVQSVMLFGCSSLKRITNLPHLYSETGIQVFIIAMSCGQLLEVRGIFKVEPLRDTEFYIMRAGLLGISLRLAVEPSPSSETILYNRFTWVKTSLQQPQILYEFGMWSIFFPAQCWALPSAARAEFISVDVPPKDGHNLLGLNLIIAYRNVSLVPSGLSITLEISNETKSLKWTYKPIVLGICDGPNNIMLWLSRWTFRNQVETGDRLKIGVRGDRGVEILTSGVVLDLKNELVVEGRASCAVRALCDVDISAYEVARGTYELDNSLDRQLQLLIMQAHNNPHRPDRSDRLDRSQREVFADVNAWIGQVSFMLKAVEDEASNDGSTSTTL